MPFNRRVPFFYINKSQQSLDTLRQQSAPSKKRSNSQQKQVGGYPTEESAVGGSDVHESDKLFHTIGAISSTEFLQNPYARNANWVQLEESINDLFNNNGQLESGMLKQTHENIDSLLNSISILCYERLKSQILPKAIRSLKTRIQTDENYVDSLSSVWRIFFREILSTLHCMLYSIEPFNNVSIRRTALTIFRDQILVNSPLESKLKEWIEQNRKIPEDIVHMVLIIQSIFEPYPPSENKLQIEKIAALVISPYIGYYGLYENHSQVPTIKSNEPYRRPWNNVSQHYQYYRPVTPTAISPLVNDNTPTTITVKTKFRLYPVNESDNNLLMDSTTNNNEPSSKEDSITNHN